MINIRHISFYLFLFLLTFLLFPLFSVSQLQKEFINRDTTDLTLGTKINPYEVEYDTTAKLTFSGYFDTYYAYYTDSINPNGFCKFPTSAPRNNQVGINIIQLSVKYESNNFRGVATVFGGDCPQSSWSSHLNFIQEANAGFRIVKKLWVDAGFFRTHFGLESIQPRENVTMSTSIVNCFEPYFLSGLKLTWQQSSKFLFQLHAFNSFNQFIETNKNKALGFSLVYSPTSKITATLSSIVSDESPDHQNYDQTYCYNDFLLTYKSNKWILGFEANYGLRTNSVLSDSTKTAFVFSNMVLAKYRITPKWAMYSRAEIFSDPNEILTGQFLDQNNQLIGLDILGGTVGFEYKPISNSYFRIESRYLQSKKSESIFYYNDASQNYRLEFIVGLGLWF